MNLELEPVRKQLLQHQLALLCRFLSVELVTGRNRIFVHLCRNIERIRIRPLRQSDELVVDPRSIGADNQRANCNVCGFKPIRSRFLTPAHCAVRRVRPDGGHFVDESWSRRIGLRRCRVRVRQSQLRRAAMLNKTSIEQDFV